jgi:hypothetical protein
VAENFSGIWQRIARRIRVPVGFAFTVLYVWLASPTWTSIFGGSLLVVIGVVIRALASGHLKKNEELATGGPCFGGAKLVDCRDLSGDFRSDLHACDSG